MSKTLVIAEKPSVAGDLSRALGKFEKKKDYYENDDYVISSAIGHLVELCLPSEMEKKRGKWSFENLPVIPDEFELRPISKTESRFKLLRRLMKRKDVDTLVNACDAGREGELIFNYITDLAGNKKPVKRLWLQSMTRDAIRTAFDRLRDEQDMRPLANAAICRSESDWLVGINGTRAMTAFNTKQNGGGFQKTPVGRVQTPTLAILVEREEKIRAHKPEPFFEVYADFEIEAGQYRARWIDPQFKKPKDQDDADKFKPERIWEREQAEEIATKCKGKPGQIEEKTKPSSSNSPLLFDLTSLQREANGRYGFSARRTLQIAQALYERHKVLTYPRTDSRFLPEDNLSTVMKVLGNFKDPDLARLGKKALDQNWVKKTRRVFDNSKVSDHSAIIPTGHAPRSLDDAHQKIFDLVSRRLIAIFYPQAKFETTTRLTTVESEVFKTEGKVLIEPGWLEVYGRKAGDSRSKTDLPASREGELADTLDVEVRENITKPPARFTESTLLSAMEGAGKFVEDDELSEALKEKGIGTPATRAAIIEGLINEKYVLREGKELIAQNKGISLIYLLQSLQTDVLCSPELTGEWEYKLKQMESGELDRETFMREIRGLTKQIVEKAKNFDGQEIEGNYVTLDIKCPKCGGGPIKEDYSFFRCQDCDLQIRKMLASHQLTPEEVTTLLTKGEVGPIDDFISKRGRPFSANLKLGENYRAEFDFGDDEGQGQSELDENAEPARVIGDRWKIFETEKAFFCEDTEKKDSKKNRLRIGKTILQRPIELEQVAKLVADGKTDLIAGFISKRGRPFDAYLTLNDEKVGFEFPERKSRGGGSKAGAKAGSKAAGKSGTAAEKNSSGTKADTEGKSASSRKSGS